MKLLSEHVKSELKKRGAIAPCTRCGSKNFIIYNTVKELEIIDGLSLPYAVMVCQNCGYIIQHAIGSLNLLNEAQNDE